ncbi:MAG: hypothetical protein SGILL_002277 [Bacillariaceae sp.]
MSSASEYMVGPMIGQGGFSHVVYAVHKHSERKVAIKVIEQVSLRRHPWLLQAVMTEKKILQQASKTTTKDTQSQSTSWIVELWAAFYDEQQMYLVLELCSGGDLEGLLLQVFGNENESAEDSTERNTRRKAWFEHSLHYYASQLLQAVNYLHTEKRVLHCDLKPGNCLLDADTGHLKLADFASAIDMATQGQNCSDDSIIPRGTCEYSCLEIIRANSPSSLSEAVDYWSVGCVLHAMSNNGKSPFSRESEASTIQAVAGFCTAPNTLLGQSFEEQSTSRAEWMEMGAQLLQPKPQVRIRAWTEVVIKNEATKVGHSADISNVVLPKPSWQTQLDSAALKDGSAGWATFQSF